MRNAAASFDDDFALREPARKKPARRATTGAKKKKGKHRFPFKLNMTTMARYAAIGMSATVAIGIMVNALVLQKSRHPAPLFGKSFALGDTPAPPPAPKAAMALPEPAPMPVAKPEAVSQPDETPVASNDQIARLLQGGPVPGDRVETKTVLGAQRALAKLGFAVKPTGTFGPQTKKALALFEKDRHLPVGDELTHRVLKILAAESGLKIER